jgi:hypothetical protein
MSSSTAVETNLAETTTAEITLTLNGQAQHVALDPRTSLLDALRSTST